MMMPLIGYTILESIEIASNTCITFADKCIIGIRANVERCRQYAESSLMVITAITPKIGYEAAAKIAKKAMETRKSIKELLVEEGIVTKEEVDKILDIKKLTEGGIIT
jgi:aspartate ammonia-lyase